MPSSLPYIKNGQMRALAVSTDKRLDVMPDVPAMAEFLPGYEASGWYGIAAPQGRLPEIVERLNDEINAQGDHGAGRPGEASQRATCRSIAGTPEALRGASQKQGIDRVRRKVIKAAGIQPQVRSAAPYSAATAVSAMNCDRYFFRQLHVQPVQRLELGLRERMRRGRLISASAQAFSRGNFSMTPSGLMRSR